MTQKRIARKSKKVKRPRRLFNYTALTVAQWRAVETLAVQPASSVPLAERVGKLLNKAIPFDGSLPTGSGDESSEAARLGLEPEA